MMYNTLPLLLLALTTTTFAAPYLNDDYVEVVPQKRAALVLDRLLVALQKALRDESTPQRYERPDRDGPRTAPLRFVNEDSDMVCKRFILVASCIGDFIRALVHWSDVDKQQVTVDASFVVILMRSLAFNTPYWHTAKCKPTEVLV